LDEMTRTYPGSRAESEAAYGAEAPFLARDGWSPVTTTYRPGAVLLAVAVLALVALPVAIIALGWALGGLLWLVAAGILVSATKDNGALRVTFRREVQ
jgi:hypothetical protein